MRKSLVIVLFVCLLALVVLSAPTTASAQIRISVAFGPPALPIYVQPICPGEGYIWTPGYWAWDDDGDDYYWVPGTWVLAPEVGYLWTPPWWGWEGGAYLFHVGFWGPHVGWYGGINYGFGYFGEGFVGGRWDHDRFFYNREVTNINIVNVHNVYNEHIEYRDNHVSYNGGAGGIEARPRPEYERYNNERHLGPVAAQQQHFQEARGNRELRASVNQGRPPIAATPRAGEFRGDVVPAREAGAPYRPPADRGAARGGQPGGNMARPENNGRPPVHPNEFPKYERPAPASTGNPNLDRKYQQQQEKMYAKQDQQRQQLQQRQEQDHQRMQQRNANDAQRQQMEQRHQQQTQQLQQRHTQQQQQMQQRQAPREHR